MDIHELRQFESVYKPSKEVTFCWLRKQYVQLSTEENHTEIIDHANDSLRVWQAAKAQAVLEGFVLVEREKLAMIFETATNALVYHAAPPKHDALSIIQGIARNTMIEVLEPSNDQTRD